MGGKLSKTTKNISTPSTRVTSDDSVKVPFAAMHHSRAAQRSDLSLGHRNGKNLQCGNSDYTNQHQRASRLGMKAPLADRSVGHTNICLRQSRNNLTG